MDKMIAATIDAGTADAEAVAFAVGGSQHPSVRPASAE
jgi:hypothetical protein